MFLFSSPNNAACTCVNGLSSTVYHFTSSFCRWITHFGPYKHFVSGAWRQTCKLVVASRFYLCNCSCWGALSIQSDFIHHCIIVILSISPGYTQTCSWACGTFRQLNISWFRWFWKSINIYILIIINILLNKLFARDYYEFWLERNNNNLKKFLTEMFSLHTKTPSLSLLQPYTFKNVYLYVFSWIVRQINTIMHSSKYKFTSQFKCIPKYWSFMINSKYF